MSNDMLIKYKERQAILLATRNGLWASKSYNPKMDMPNPRPDIISDLDLIIKLCDIIEFIKEGYKEEVYRNLFKGDPFYMWIMSGLTSCYKDEEISKIDIKKYRRPYDQIANGKEVNLEELASAGKFFRIMHEKADQSLPFRYIPPLPKDFDRY